MFVEITKKYYYYKPKTGCNMERIVDSAPFLLNLSKCLLIEPHLSINKMKFLILFRTTFEDIDIPCIEFSTSKELELEFKKLKDKLL